MDPDPPYVVIVFEYVDACMRGNPDSPAGVADDVRNVGLVDRNPFKLIVGGSGPMREYYTNLSRKLGVIDNISFVGYIPDENLAEYYNGCKLFVLPSTDPTREGFGIVLLEAMACGRPVISTKITGVAKDIADRGAGIVVEPENTKALARAIRAILSDHNLADAMGAAGRSLVLEKYSSEKIADTMIKIYLEAVHH